MVKNNKVYIIAEIGNNHNGSLDLARKTIKSAAKSGVDAVKFQSFKTEEFMANKKLKHNYKTSKGIKSPANGDVLSIRKVAPLDGADSKTLPPTSSPIERATVTAPSPEVTLCV